MCGLAIINAWTSHLLNHEIGGTDLSRPTLVLVHGVAGSLHIWDPVFDQLAAHYRVVRLDLLGYGHSLKPRLRYTPQVHVAAIRHTLREQGILPPYNLVGLSMGVTLVLEFAALFPDEVRQLAAIGFPYYQNRAEAERGLKHNLWAGLTISHPIFAQFFVPVAWWLGRIGVLPPRLFTKIYSPLMASDTLLNPYRVFRSNIWNCMVHPSGDLLLDASGKLKRLFIHGERDMWAPAETVRKAVEHYSNTQFVTIPNAEHNLVVLEPKETVRLLLDFFA